jgi:hypothetical protein
MRKVILLLIVILLFLGCKNPHIGLKVEPTQYDQWFNNKVGHHRTSLPHIILDYDYSIKGNRIHFNGTINCTPEMKDWDRANLDITFYFINKEKIIVSANHFSTLGSENLCEEKPFVADYPYPQDNLLVGVRYYYELNASE